MSAGTARLIFEDREWSYECGVSYWDKDDRAQTWAKRWLRVWRLENGTLAAMVTEYPDDDGQSIANRAETINEQLRKAFPHESIILLYHYMPNPDLGPHWTALQAGKGSVEAVMFPSQRFPETGRLLIPTFLEWKRPQVIATFGDIFAPSTSPAAKRLFLLLDEGPVRRYRKHKPSTRGKGRIK